MAQLFCRIQVLTFNCLFGLTVSPHLRTLLATKSTTDGEFGIWVELPAIDHWFHKLGEVNGVLRPSRRLSVMLVGRLPQMQGVLMDCKMLLDAARDRSPTAGYLDGWSWSESKVLRFSSARD